MKPISISAEALFEEHQPLLRWEWIAGHGHPERRFDEAAVRDALEAISGEIMVDFSFGPGPSR